MAVSRKALSRIPKAQFPCRLTTNFLLCFGYHVGRLESKQKDQLVVILNILYIIFSIVELIID